MIILFLLILLVHQGYSIKTLSFESTSDENIAYQVPQTSTPLPPIFTFCASFKEPTIGESSFFTMFGESDDPWLTVVNWVVEDQIQMWMRISKMDWIKVWDLPPYWLNFWIYICIKVDSLADTLFVSLNGESPVSFVMNGINENRPTNLKGKMYIGLSKIYERRQFQGEVSNINIFSDSKNFDLLSAGPCEHIGDILQPDSEWERVAVVKEVEEEDWKVCNKNKAYHLVIPEKLKWVEAVDACMKLGGGHITEPGSEEDIKRTIELFEMMNLTCEHIWTPISDEEVEGEFRSSITGDLVTYLPWLENMPDGGNVENNVAIQVSSGQYDDWHRSYAECVPCEVPKTTEFFFIGVCEDTYFGKLDHNL